MNLSYLKDAGIEDLKAKFTKHIRYYQSGIKHIFKNFSMNINIYQRQIFKYQRAFHF